MNSRQKGKRGERALRDELREAGFHCWRTQQYAGKTGEACDVTVPSLPTFHFECKFTEQPRLWDWIAQAERDAAPNRKIPVICHRRNRSKTWAILPFDQLLDIIRRSDLVERSDEKAE